MSVPDWYEVVLLALAAWRVFQLVGEDDILERPRRFVTRAGKAHQNDAGTWVNVPENYRENLARFIECPYCAGFWIALGWWGAWQLEPHGTLVATVPFALSAGVVAGHKLLSSETE